MILPSIDSKLSSYKLVEVVKPMFVELFFKINHELNSQKDIIKGIYMKFFIFVLVLRSRK